MSSSEFSKLQHERLAFKPPLPAVLKAASQSVVAGAPLLPPTDADKLATLFPKTFGKPSLHVEAGAGSGAATRPLKVGAVLSGGQAPGGHNILSGIYDYVVKRTGGTFYGFLNGPAGLFNGQYVQIDDAMIDRYRNTGGFDAIGSGRDKIETPEQFAGSRAVAEKLGLDGVIVIGGDDSNTNAAVLAEYFEANGSTCKVVGCPKTIDGDLKIAEHVDISFGFDTACRTYSELIGNVCSDALGSGKYWHFIRLMGRAASNITLECALQTHPNITLLGEEVAARHQNLSSITEEIVAVIQQRAAAGKNYGVVLVPEGLIEFVPEMNALLKEINDILAGGTPGTVEAVADALSANSAALFSYLPASIKRQLLADRDPHGNVQVSLIETEKLLAELVKHELDRLARGGKCPLAPAAQSWPISFQFHFFGYEGRCGLPSDFDTTYCYSLGYNAGLLLGGGATGVMSSVTNLGAPVRDWKCAGIPLTAFFNIERRKGKDKPVIKKALVELWSLPFKTFTSHRARWALEDCYRNPGPIQLSSDESGDAAVELCFTLALELKERANGVVPPHAATAGEAALAGYQGLVEGLCIDGPAPSAVDLERLHHYRLAHGVTDEAHYAVLEKLGITKDAFRGMEAAARSKAAASA